MSCPICKGVGYTVDGGTVFLCPNDCDGGQKQFNAERLADGETSDDILGLKAGGQSIVEPFQRGGRTVLREDENL